jgi:hypothetical protein
MKAFTVHNLVYYHLITRIDLIYEIYTAYLKQKTILMEKIKQRII